jgi:ubiquitin C-terminal hydrolase
LALRECLLNELTPKEDGSGDESLYTNMKSFWDLFSSGRLTSTVTCTTCGTISTTNCPFEALLLYFPRGHHVSDQDCSVEDLIAHHCEIEDIPDFQCDHCNGRTLGKRVYAITTCPTILCIVLHRKKQDGRSIKSSVQFPLSGLNITEDGLQYNLVGTVHHKPDGHEHGHYTSICHSQRSHDWYLYDDERVSHTQFVKKQQKGIVLKRYTKTAFILFYELQTHDGSEDIIDLQSNDTDGSGESRFSAS